MPISVICGCGKAFSVPDNLAGRRGRCKACGLTVEIPGPAAADTFPTTIDHDEGWDAAARPEPAPSPPPAPIPPPPALPPSQAEYEYRMVQVAPGRVRNPLHRSGLRPYPDAKRQLLSPVASSVVGGGPWTTSLDSAA